MAENKSALVDLTAMNSFAERRFVSSKETVAYVLNDASYSLNINDFKDRYIYDVVKIDFDFLAFQNIFATVWDTINDTFIGTVVEKTRTRWGKFRPYLLGLAVPGCIATLLYWFMPVLFSGTAADSKKTPLPETDEIRRWYFEGGL